MQITAFLSSPLLYCIPGASILTLKNRIEISRTQRLSEANGVEPSRPLACAGCTYEGQTTNFPVKIREMHRKDSSEGSDPNS